MNPEETKIYANAINLLPQLGPVKISKLLAQFGDYKTAWNSDSSELAKIGIDQKSIQALAEHKRSVNPEAEYEKLKSNGINVLLASDTAYPEQLKEIAAFPPILYTRGDVRTLKALSVAVVGTRKMSSYGKQAILELVPSLAVNKIAVVSGLAFGVDFEALSSCIKSGGIAIAVLATALDDNSISPRSNFNLAQEIISAGCLVSEYPLGSSVQKQNFPIRNRLISGLCRATLVIEADEESGSLITANYALEQNREVFAVPGSIFSPVSRGTNELIKKGAKPVTSIKDILQELNLDLAAPEIEVAISDSEEESAIMNTLTKQPQHVDELIKTVKLPASKINAMLTILELKGRIKNLGGSNYVKIR